MAQEDKTSGATGLPGWLIGLFWSVIGVVVAVLTIIILTAYFLWLVLWGTGLTGTPANQRAMDTTGRAASENAAASSSGETLAAAQAATATAAQLSGTPAPGLTADQSVGQTGSGTTPGSDAAEPEDAEDGGSSGGDQSGTAQADGQSPRPEQTGEFTAAAGQDGQAVGIDSTSTGEATSTASTLTPSPTTTPSPTSTPTPTSTSTPTSTPTPTPTPTPEPQAYIVQTDDWLSRLSDKFYGDILAYPAIVEATNAKAAEDDSYTFISDPDVIEVGQKLWIPTLAEAEILLANEKEQ